MHVWFHPQLVQKILNGIYPRCRFIGARTLSHVSAGGNVQVVTSFCIIGSKILCSCIKNVNTTLLVSKLFLDCRFLPVSCGELLFLLHIGHFFFVDLCSDFGTGKTWHVFPLLLRRLLIPYLL